MESKANQTFDFELFASDTFKVLKIMYESSLNTKEETMYCKLSQTDLVNISHFCKSKIYTILNELKNNGYIEHLGYSKYLITQKTIDVFKIFNL